MSNDQMQRVRQILESMEESARPGFDDEHIQHLRILVRLAVQFYDYLTLTADSDDAFRDLNYVLDSLFFNIESFRVVTRTYGILVGASRSTVDWSAIGVSSLKEQFISLYDSFVSQINFETKCRLLLDLIRLYIIYAGAFYECRP